MGELTDVERILTELVARCGGPTLELLCEASTRALDIDGMSLAVISGPSLRETMCAHGTDALKIDQLQFVLGEGPCLQACFEGRPVLVSDVGEKRAGRWPVFANAVAQTAPHLRAIFGFPLLIGAHGIGAMNLYRDHIGELSPDQVREAQRACELAVPLMLAQLPVETDTHFQHTVVDRTVVYQATGLIMVGHELSAQDAFARLRAYAFTHERTLEDVATDIAGHRLLLPRDPGPPKAE